MNYCIDIILNKCEINCLYIVDDDSFSYDIMMNEIKDFFFKYNSKKYFKYTEPQVKITRIFEDMGGRLTKDSYNSMKANFYKHIWLPDVDEESNKKIACMSFHCINNNVCEARYTFTINFDSKYIKVPFLYSVRKDNFKKLFKEDDNTWNYDELDEVDYDFDNISFNEFEEMSSFITRHIDKEFRTSKKKNFVVFCDSFKKL